MTPEQSTVNQLLQANDLTGVATVKSARIDDLLNDDYPAQTALHFIGIASVTTDITDHYAYNTYVSHLT